MLTPADRSAGAVGRPAGVLGALVLALVLALLVSLPDPPTAAAQGAPQRGASGLPLPRFLSLSSDEANLRTGPGVRYPIAWVFVRRDMPLEVTAEFELWRKVRDIDGAEGWAHKSLLSGRRTALIVGEIRALHREPDATSPPVLFAEPGVHGRLLACRPEWCRMAIAGREGWLPRTQIWGVHPWETFE